MFKKIKEITVVLATSLMLFAPALVPVTAHAAVDPNNTATTSGLCNGLDNANGSNNAAGGTNVSCANDSTSTSSINGIIHTVINFFSLIVGAVSIIMIIYGGFKYVTSGGNDGNIGSAKNTIVYALIGLVIVALAQVIVRFVLGKVTA